MKKDGVPKNDKDAQTERNNKQPHAKTAANPPAIGELPFPHTKIKCSENEKQLAIEAFPAPFSKAVFAMIKTAGGYGFPANNQAIAHRLYELEESNYNKIDPPSNTSSNRKNKGVLRVENFVADASKASRAEIEVHHNAFAYAFGEEWAKLIPPEKLFTLSPSQILLRGLEAHLPMPDLPELASLFLRIMAEEYATTDLEIRIAVLGGKRPGVVPGSRNETFRASETLPKHTPGSRFEVQLRGLKPDEQVLVIEAFDDLLISRECNEPALAFPTPMVKAASINQTLKGDGVPSLISEAEGHFNWYVVTGPDLSFLSQLADLDLSAERWKPEELLLVVKALRTAKVQSSDNFRIATYRYCV